MNSNNKEGGVWNKAVVNFSYRSLDSSAFQICANQKTNPYPHLCVDEYMKRCLEIRLIQAIVKD